ARYLLPRHEPLGSMRTTTFIRMLIWTDQPVARVDIEIDGSPHPHPAVYRGKETSNDAGDTTKTPLWVAPWDPAEYDDGAAHVLAVTVIDTGGKSTTVQTPLSFAGGALPLHNGATGGWIMRHDIAAIFRAASIITYLVAGALLVVAPRVYYALLPAGCAQWLLEQAALHRQDRTHVRQLWDQVAHGSDHVWARPVLPLAAAACKMLARTQRARQVHWASIPWLFWPAYALTMGLATLPLFTGWLIPSAGPLGVGSLYAYGIYLAAEWVPLADSW
ncbi:hypothetical protein LPJ61_006391, partial [Coemansia biformis]